MAALFAGRRGLRLLLPLVPLSAFVLLLTAIPLVVNEVPVKEHYRWVEGLGFHLDFYLDGLSLLFALLITGIGALVTLYAGAYLSDDPTLPRFFVFLFLFMGSMLGVAISDNVFSLFVFWELTSLSSYLLIGYNHGDASSRKSALQALLVTGLGGLALLAGLLMTSMATGTPLISEWKAQGIEIVEHPHFVIMTVLILLGAFTKSAQFPFHFWLPNAMAAPTPVSAYLHSATMVKAGVFMIARLDFGFSSGEFWGLALMSVGGITMLTGAVYAYLQSDLKRILAYTTVSALGLLVFSIGMGSAVAIQGAMMFLLAHALYKGALFMAAGSVDHGTGSRDIDTLPGLWRKMPITGIATLMAALSMAGIPFFAGFIAKELLYEASLPKGILPVAALLLTGALFVSIALLLGFRLFFRKNPTPPDPKIHEAPPGMYAGPLILGFAGLIVGIFPEQTVGSLLAAAAVAVKPGLSPYPLALWHGLTPALLLSAVTLALGICIYFLSSRARGYRSSLQTLEKVGPENLHDGLWAGLLKSGEFITSILQSGYLRYYIITILLTLFSLAFFTMHYYGLNNFNSSLEGVSLYEYILAALVVISLLFIIRSDSRLAAIAILGVAGYGIAIFYSMYGAIDLAMTQFLVETITVVVFVYVLYKLPGYIKLSADIYHVRDAIIAIAGGAAMSAIVLLITNYPLASELKVFYAENSYVLAKGRNVVNVILVDFRAMDTLGEIVVLFIAAMGVMVLSLLRIRKTSNNKLDP